MKTKILLLLIVILCLGGVLYYATRDEKDTRWKSPEAWKGVEKGMAEEQVEQLLGKPGQIIHRGTIRWYYQDLPRKIHKEPSNGYVTFGAKKKQSINENGS